jgi:nitrite reductase (NO-forming) / hydroxylamine reductase
MYKEVRMRRQLTLFSLLLIGLLGLQACGEASPVATSTPTAEPAAEATSTINLGPSSVQPAVLVVAPGTTVTWSNMDAVAHTLAASEKLFDPQPLSPGQNFSFTFDRPGRYDFACADKAHEMYGSILVQASSEQIAFGGKPVDVFFADTCGGCHSADRRGGTGPALMPGRLTESDDFYRQVIHDGRPETVMTPWGSTLSDEEIEALVAYIKSPINAAASEWEMEDIAASRSVLVPDDQLAEKPSHSGDLSNLMLITEREARSIAVVDGNSFKLLGHIAASYRAHGYAFDPTSDRWVYNVGRDGWLFKIDLYTLRAVTQVRVGFDSRGIAISDDGRWLIVGNYMPATAVILKADTLEPVKVIETRGADPEGNEVDSRVCIVSDVSAEMVGPYFVIALKDAGQMWRIDWSQPDFPIAKVEQVGHILHDGFLSPDNTRFYIASQTDNWMSVIDVPNWKLIAKISTGDKPHPGSGATWTWRGKTYGATVHAGEGKIAIWDLATDELVAEIPTGGPGLFIRTYEGDESYPYVWADSLFGEPSNRIYVIDKDRFEVVKVIDEGKRTLHPEFTADGKYVYVADWDDNKVRVYDAGTLERVAEIGDITTPSGLFNTHRRVEYMGH